MRKGIFMMGTQGSGKTTWVKANCPGYRHINTDLIAEKNPMKNSKAVKQSVKEFENAVANGEDFVFDRVSASTKNLKELFNIAKSAGYHLTLVYIRVPLKIALFRNQSRERVMSNTIVAVTWQRVRKVFRSARNWPWNDVKIVKYTR